MYILVLAPPCLTMSGGSGRVPTMGIPMEHVRSPLHFDDRMTNLALPCPERAGVFECFGGNDFQHR